MDNLILAHNPWLVLASLCVALIAGFTGLSLTYGLANTPPAHRKVAIALASVALGGGIWSMHFVAMLGLQLPFLFYYDAVITLISALVAILIVGAALLILHFHARTLRSVALSGALVGLGILIMHYTGMSGLELCRATYSVPAVLLASVASVGLSILAFHVAYGRREHRNVVLGTLCFGGSVFLVHFVAIAGTRIEPIAAASAIGPPIGREALAVGVVLTTFLLCAAFLLTSVTFLAPQAAAPAREPAPEPEPTDGDAWDKRAPHRQVPYEVAGRTFFMDADAIAVVRAEGHYTQIYTSTDKHFCVWTISEAERRLGARDFVRCHRSFLVNPQHVTSFERLKDNGVCHFDRVAHLSRVPVSRSHLGAVRDALGI